MRLKIVLGIWVIFNVCGFVFGEDGCRYDVKNYGDAVFHEDCLKLGRDEFVGAVRELCDEFMLRQKSSKEPRGMFFAVRHDLKTDFNPSELLQNLGFEPYGMNQVESIWVMKGDSPIPAFASAISGSKALLVRKRSNDFDSTAEEVLLVVEKDGDGRWTLPGGAVEMFELFEDAGRREILEEVGLKGRFERVLAVLNRARVLGDMTDYCVYSVYRLEELETGNDMILQESEIEKAEWFDFNDLIRNIRFAENGVLPKLNNREVSPATIRMVSIYGCLDHAHRVEVVAPVRIECEQLNNEEKCVEVQQDGMRYYQFPSCPRFSESIEFISH
jgi:8-oxo-dGTP diphosphatase